MSRIRSDTREFSHRRLKNEFNTIYAMIRIYCRAHHGAASASGGDPCRECLELLDYARKRLLHCPFQQDKPTCGNCTIHCYQKGMRDRIREVMRYSGPRMIYRHPVMALRHLLDGRREPPKPGKQRS